MNDLRPPERAFPEATSGPRISVVMPVFNADKYLGEAIESVLGQDYADFELLIVDDGSTDESAAIADGYTARDRRIIHLHHPDHANLGTTVSRNLALKQARGEFIAFIDADDRWRPSKLGEQAELLDCMPDVGAIFGAVNYWASHAGGNDESVPTGHERNRPIRPPEALLKVYPLGIGNSPCPSDLLVRRTVLDKVGGFEEAFVGPLFLYEDQAFFLKLYANATIYFSDEVWLDYRLHSESCTAVGLRDGLAREARRHCLEWFESYLPQTRYRRDPFVRLALYRALRPYRHPHLTRVGRLAKALFRAESAGSQEAGCEPGKSGAHG